MTKFDVDDIVRQFISDIDQVNNTSKIFTTTNLGNNQSHNYSLGSMISDEEDDLSQSLTRDV